MKVAVLSNLNNFQKFCHVCNDQEDDDAHQHDPQHKVNQMLHNFYQNR